MPPKPAPSNDGAETPSPRRARTWLIVVEYAEDIYPNNASWPLPVLVGEYLAAQLGGRSEDEPLPCDA